MQLVLVNSLALFNRANLFVPLYLQLDSRLYRLP